MIEDIQQQLIRDLVVESTEGLDQFDRDLLALESGAADEETLHRIFRTIHTIKGSSGCLGLHRIERVAHAGENLLSLMRDGVILAGPDLLTKLFRYSDALRAMMNSLSDSGAEPDQDHASLIADLNALHQAATRAEASVQAGASGLFSDDDAPQAEPAPARSDSPLQTAASGLFSDDDEAEPTVAPQQPVESAVEPKAALSPAASVAAQAPAAAETAIRVDVAQLDTLMDLVGELVLARNQILQYAANCGETAFLQSAQQLNMITTKLQANVMKTRMQPVGNVWAKFPRIVRDLAKELGKRVSLVMEGSETEMDRSILEAIKDPLTHLVRNSIDHGLETEEVRLRTGKSAQGQLRLRAFHEGGQVIIEITDDGAGIDRDRVIRKALDRALIGAEQAGRLTDREVFALIFLPGFSTAEAVTSISGRGVGMDVVKKNVERIGGTVDVQSERGRSTSIWIKIPLTLAIIPALIIRCARNRYAIPQANLVELVRIDEDQRATAIEYVGGYPVYRLRGNLLPLVELREQLELGKEEPGEAHSVFLLVLQAEGRQFGLVVDSILDTEEIVVKPLGKELKMLTTYAGATIMGDGRVALILDIIGIARRAKLLDDLNHLAREANANDRDSEGEQRETLLLIGMGEGRRAAVPVSSVSRLEEFPPSLVERSAGSEVVQYRGEIMPLVRLHGVPGSADQGAAQDPVRVVVYNLRGRSFGLVVERVLDIVENESNLQPCQNRPGILGSAVVQGRVTDFLDVPFLVSNSDAVEFGSEECRA